MLLELAVDGEQPPEGDSTDSTEVDGSSSAEQPTEDSDTDDQENDVEPLSEFDIDGEKVTAEQIREWKRGNMRQSDYTRKTQEIAAIRNEAKEALELYNYLKANPEIAKKLAEESPQQQETVKNIMNPDLQQINIELSTMKIENALRQIMSNDKDVTEVELIEIANKEHVTIETAYEMWRGRNLDKIIDKRLKEQSLNITNKIKNNNNKVKSLVTEKKGDDNPNFGLSDREVEMAGKLGMTAQEYAEWKPSSKRR